MSQYDEKAAEFLRKTGAEIKTEFLRFDKYFPDDKEARDIYQATLSRGKRTYTFTFGQSINNSGNWEIKENHGVALKTADNLPAGEYPHNSRWRRKKRISPTAYDILSALTKTNPGTFEDFCSVFGYDTDSRKAKKTYNAVMKEYLNLAKLFNDQELEEMGGIQ